MGDTMDQLLTAAEAGRLLGLKISTVRRLTHTRDLPCVRPTGRRCVRYRLSDLQALIRMRSQPARGGTGLPRMSLRPVLTPARIAAPRHEGDGMKQRKGETTDAIQNG